MNCSACGKEVKACEHCMTSFDVSDEVICTDVHLHSDCFEAWLKTAHNWEIGEVLEVEQ